MLGEPPVDDVLSVDGPSGGHVDEIVVGVVEDVDGEVFIVFDADTMEDLNVVAGRVAAVLRPINPQCWNGQRFDVGYGVVAVSVFEGRECFTDFAAG